jgi:hypothetical protein
VLRIGFWWGSIGGDGGVPVGADRHRSVAVVDEPVVMGTE